MARKVIVDAGPIIAFLDKRSEFHEWAKEQFARFPAFETCEAALAESCAVLAYARCDPTKVLKLVECGALLLSFRTQPNIGRIISLMEKYGDRPMDFADACLVIMTEEKKDALMVTLDDDFSVYRRRGRDLIPTLKPA